MAQAPDLANVDVAEPNWRAAIERLRGAFADRTLAAYVHHFARFESWCRDRQLVAAPAMPEVVATYLEASFRRFTPNTVVAQMHAIRRVHRAMRLSDPTLSDDVWLTIRRGKRGAPPPRQALAINAALRDRLTAACPDTLIGQRDRVLVRLAYDTLCRRFELVDLRIEDLSPLPDGTARILVRGGKQDVGDTGEYAYISVGTLRELRRWLAAARLNKGEVLRTVMKGRVGGRIRDPGVVNLRLRTLGLAAGLEPTLVAGLSGHSTRVGAAQDLAAAGHSLLEIMRAGRWRSPHLVMKYVHKAPVRVWAPSEGDGFPLARQARSWRRRALAARASGSSA